MLSWGNLPSGPVPPAPQKALLPSLAGAKDACSSPGTGPACPAASCSHPVAQSTTSRAVSAQHFMFTDVRVKFAFHGARNWASKPMWEKEQRPPLGLGGGLLGCGVGGGPRLRGAGHTEVGWLLCSGPRPVSVGEGPRGCVASTGGRGAFSERL